MEDEIPVFALIGITLLCVSVLGFLILQSGISQRKNATSTLVNGVIAVLLSAFSYLVFGYSVQKSGSPGIGFPTEPEELLILLQWAPLAVLFAVIPLGAAIGRLKPPGVAIYAIAIGAGIFPIVNRFATNFESVVLLGVACGVSGLMFALVARPRAGRISDSGELQHLPVHNVPLALVGGLLAAFGITGTVFMFVESPTLNQLLFSAVTAASGGIGAVLLYRLIFGAVNPTVVIQGVIGGLIASLAFGPSVEPLNAILVGVVAGVLVVLISVCGEKLWPDDGVGVFATHFATGAWGIANAGTFSMETLKMGAFTLGSVFSLLYFLKVCGLLVASQVHQQVGLDLTQHGVNSNPDR